MSDSSRKTLDMNWMQKEVATGRRSAPVGAHPLQQAEMANSTCWQGAKCGATAARSDARLLARQPLSLPNVGPYRNYGLQNEILAQTAAAGGPSFHSARQPLPLPAAPWPTPPPGGIPPHNMHPDRHAASSFLPVADGLHCGVTPACGPLVLNTGSPEHAMDCAHSILQYILATYFTTFDILILAFNWIEANHEVYLTPSLESGGGQTGIMVRFDVRNSLSTNEVSHASDIHKQITLVNPAISELTECVLSYTFACSKAKELWKPWKGKQKLEYMDWRMTNGLLVKTGAYNLVDFILAGCNDMCAVTNGFIPHVWELPITMFPAMANEAAYFAAALIGKWLYSDSNVINIVDDWRAQHNFCRTVWLAPVIDPTLTGTEVLQAQAAGFDSAARILLVWNPLTYNCEPGFYQPPEAGYQDQWRSKEIVVFVGQSSDFSLGTAMTAKYELLCQQMSVLPWGKKPWTQGPLAKTGANYCHWVANMFNLVKVVGELAPLAMSYICYPEASPPGTFVCPGAGKQWPDISDPSAQSPYWEPEEFMPYPEPPF